jgi:putative oxidoreductase
MSALQGLVSVVGRLFLVAIFLGSAVMNKIPHYSATLGAMEAHHVPMPELLLPGAIVFLIVGSVSVLLGYQARIGAALLAVFLVLASYYFHNFWAVPEAEQLGQMIHFQKNLGLLGAMLFIIANGPGAWSVDAARGSYHGGVTSGA